MRLQDIELSLLCVVVLVPFLTWIWHVGTHILYFKDRRNNIPSGADPSELEVLTYQLRRSVWRTSIVSALVIVIGVPSWWFMAFEGQTENPMMTIALGGAGSLICNAVTRYRQVQTEYYKVMGHA